MSAKAVRISDLHKRYGDVVAVDGLDLDICEGEIFGLLGPNGAGKTTTITMLLGLTRPSRGCVEVLGLDPAEQAREIRSRTGYAMQQLALDEYLTGRENLQIFAELYNVEARSRKERVGELLEWAGLQKAGNRLVRTYSGGMKRRLNLVLSLLHRPELFFLDEPTLGLDVQSRRQLWRLIEEVKASGTTVILTTHYLEEANQLCDRLGVMDQGKLVALGTPEELKQRLADDLHRLTITFVDVPPLDDLDLPVPAQVRGADVVFSGAHSRLWAVLAMFEDRFGEDIGAVAYSKPTLDDVVLRLTQSETEAQVNPGEE